MAGSDDGTLRARARRGLAIYFSIVVVLSAVLEYLVLSTREPIQKHPGLIFLLMWTPAAASVVARIAMREGFRDVSFRLGGRQGARALTIAWFYPLLVGFAAYGAAWAAKLARFTPPPLASLGLDRSPGWERFSVLLVLTLTLGTLVSVLSAAGEEIGWRGYMLTRLIDAGTPRPVLVSGVIWACWHMPLILSGQYASSQKPALSAGLFLIDVVAFAYLAARLRLDSGSVWPAVVIHASWNAIIQGVFDASSVGGELWIGESGILTCVANVAFVALFVSGIWKPKRSPGEPYPQPVRALAV
jgi:CAAX protease family protein